MSELCRLLRDEEDAVASEAAQALVSHLPGSPALQAVMTELEAPAPRPLLVIGALQRRGGSVPEEAVAPLARALRDEDAVLRATAAEVLGGAGERAVEPLLRAVADPNPWVAEQAVAALGRAGKGPRVRAALLHVIRRAPGSQLAITAARALIALQRRSDGPPDLALDDEDVPLVAAALCPSLLDSHAQRALIALGPRAACVVPDLAAAMLDRRAVAALQVLAAIGLDAPGALDAVLRGANAPDPVARRRALALLRGRTGPTITTALVAALSDLDVHVRRAAALHLARTSASERAGARAALQAHLAREGDVEVRAALEVALQ